MDTFTDYQDRVRESYLNNHTQISEDNLLNLDKINAELDTFLLRG